MKKSVIRAALAFLVVAALLAGGAHAQSAEAPSQPAKTKTLKKKARKAVTSQPGSVKFFPGSAETAKARSTRLKRECKGQVNAGACEGFTR
jgi:hypothetical protein